MQFIDRCWCFVLAFLFAFGCATAPTPITDIPVPQGIYRLGHVDQEDGSPFFTETVPQACRRLVVFTTSRNSRGILETTAQARCQSDFPVPEGYVVDVRVDMGKRTQPAPVQFWVYDVVQHRGMRVFHEAYSLDPSAWEEAHRRFMVQLGCAEETSDPAPAVPSPAPPAFL